MFFSMAVKIRLVHTSQFDEWYAILYKVSFIAPLTSNSVAICRYYHLFVPLSSRSKGRRAGLERNVERCYCSLRRSSQYRCDALSPARCDTLTCTRQRLYRVTEYRPNPPYARFRHKKYIETRGKDRRVSGSHVQNFILTCSRIKTTDAAKLQDEYAKLVEGLQDDSSSAEDNDGFMTSPGKTESCAITSNLSEV